MLERRRVLGAFAVLGLLSLSSCIVDPFDPQEPSQVVPQGDPSEVLELVNQARSAGRSCGSEGTFGPAPALGWNEKLGRAAARHANDMASQDFLGHTGSDGSTAAGRISAEGYEWSAIGENVAAGQSSPGQVVAGWLSSPGHCANIMNPDYLHMGIARAEGGSYGIYWAQTFARPR